jgi:hypothetical protein
MALNGPAKLARSCPLSEVDRKSFESSEHFRWCPQGDVPSGRLSRQGHSPLPKRVRFALDPTTSHDHHLAGALGGGGFCPVLEAG